MAIKRAEEPEEEEEKKKRLILVNIDGPYSAIVSVFHYEKFIIVYLP
jgi:hypothetical protein